MSNSLLAELERILKTYLDSQNQNIRELNYNKEKMGDYGYLEISTEKKATEEMLDLS